MEGFHCVLFVYSSYYLGTHYIYTKNATEYYLMTPEWTSLPRIAIAEPNM